MNAAARSLWPHHWHASQFSLVAFFWAHPLQVSEDSVSVTAWSRPTVLIQQPASLGGYPVAATSAVHVFAAAQCAALSSSYCWWLSIRCCRSNALEQSATRHYWPRVTDVILPETGNFLFSVSFPWLHFSFYWSLRFLLRPLYKFLMYVCMHVCFQEYIPFFYYFRSWVWVQF